MTCPAILPLIILVSATSLAERIAPQSLPPPEFLDTEVSTNIVIAADEGSRHFSVALSLNATASNCVEVAVGNDSKPADGNLINTALENLVVRHSPDGTQLIFQ